MAWAMPLPSAQHKPRGPLSPMHWHTTCGACCSPSVLVGICYTRGAVPLPDSIRLKPTPSPLATAIGSLGSPHCQPYLRVKILKCQLPCGPVEVHAYPHLQARGEGLWHHKRTRSVRQVCNDHVSPKQAKTSATTSHYLLTTND